MTMFFFEPWGCGCLENEELEIVACEMRKDAEDNLVMFHHSWLQATSLYKDSPLLRRQ